MEKAQYGQRQARFQEEFSRLQDELDKDLKEINFSPRDLARKHQEIAILCVKYQKYDLAVEFFTKVLQYSKRKQHESFTSSSSTTTTAAAETTKATLVANEEHSEKHYEEEEEEELFFEETMINNIGAMLLRSRNVKKAKAFLHQANESFVKQKKDHRSSSFLHHLLSINYALALHANGDLENAQLIAENILQSDQTSPEEANVRITALCLLGSCAKSKCQIEKAIEYATQALNLAQISMAEPLLLARCLNNLGLYHFEQGFFQESFQIFVDAFRQAQIAQDFHQMTIVKYHLGIVLAHLEMDLSFQLHLTQAQAQAQAQRQGQGQGQVQVIPEKEQITLSEEEEDNVVVVQSTTKTKTPMDCFEQTEAFSSMIKDPILGILAQTNLAQLEYYTGNFHIAQAGFTIGLEKLKQLMKLLEEEAKQEKNGLHTSLLSSMTPEIIMNTTSTIDQLEMIKVEGYVLSYLGSIHFIEDKLDLAENFHRQDLALAKKINDINGELRALRNLALVYNCSQTYIKSVPLWKEAIQISIRIENKYELMMAYCGLGIALKEYTMWVFAGAKEGSSPPERLEEIKEKPLEIFQLQRALAIELNDKEQQILAQQLIVSVYELPDDSTQERGGVYMEQRLAECDRFVKLCEQYGTLQHRADSYLSLASALNGRISRLAQSSSRFAEAVNVLTQKRDRIIDQYQQLCTTIAKTSTATVQHQISTIKENEEIEKQEEEEKVEEEEEGRLGRRAERTNEKIRRQVFHQVETFHR